jgi:carbamoyl-phosphate synthase large subunit
LHGLQNVETMARDPIPVLVLAAGGAVSQGVLRSLAASAVPCFRIGACISPRSAGLFDCELAVVSPAARDAGFRDWLFELCAKERVRAVFAGHEGVLRALAGLAAELHDETGARAIVAPAELLELADDKLATSSWLASRGLGFPRHADAADVEASAALAREAGYPLFAKPRRTSGSRGGFRIENEADLERATRLPGYLLQEYLDDEGGEFTAGCLADRRGRVRGAIVLRRELAFSLTVRAEAGEFPAQRAEAVAIAAALGAPGPVNVQMRMRAGRPVCFEVNLRFSSTTPMRTAFGFAEVEAALRHLALGEELPEMPVITSGVALRAWRELYPEPAALAELESRGRLDTPRAHVVSEPPESEESRGGPVAARAAALVERG